jgi:tight adherence protein C
MYLYLVVGVVFLGIAVAATLQAAGARRFRTAQRLSTIHEYGFSAEAEPVRSYLDHQSRAPFLTDVITRLGDVLGRRMGKVGEDEIREQLMAAGMYTMSPRTLLGYRVLSTILAPLAMFLLFGAAKFMDIAIILIALFAGWVLPLTLVQRKARKRLEEIDRRLPDLVDLLCVMIEAGLSFPSALRLAAGEFEPPLSDELRLTLQEQTMGLGVDEALTNMAERADTPAMRAFVRAMSQGERMGISIGQIMRNLAHEMRARRRSMAEEKAQKAPVLMLFPLVFLIFPAMFIILMTPAVINLMHSFKGV